MSAKPLEYYMDGNIYVTPCSDETKELLACAHETAKQNNIDLNHASKEEVLSALERAEAILRNRKFEETA